MQLAVLEVDREVVRGVSWTKAIRNACGEANPPTGMKRAPVQVSQSSCERSMVYVTAPYKFVHVQGRYLHIGDRIAMRNAVIFHPNDTVGHTLATVSTHPPNSSIHSNKCKVCFILWR